MSKRRWARYAGGVSALLLITILSVQFVMQAFAVTSSTEPMPNFQSRSWHVDAAHGELAAGANGVIYVVSGDDIVVFDSATPSTTGSTNPTYLKTWTGFTGVEDVVYKNGTIYVAESGGVVHRFASSLAGGNVVSYATTWTGLGNGVTSMDFDGNDTVVLARSNNVEVFHPSELPIGGVPTVTSWPYSGVYVVTIDDSANIYAAAYSDHTIRRWEASDTAETPTYTGEWTGATSAFMNGLRYADDYLYVGQKSVGATGDWYRFPASLPDSDISSSPARESIHTGSDPEGIVADASGNVYGANWSASTIQKFIVPQNLADLTYDSRDIHIALPSNASITSHGVVSASAEDGSYKYPFGLVNLTFMTASSGANVTINAYFETNLSPAQVTPRKFNSQTNTYADLADPTATVTQATWNGHPALRLTYSVTDGSADDEDGTANGVIVDPVGLGVTEPLMSVTTGVASDITKTGATIHGTALLRSDITLGDLQTSHFADTYGPYIFTTYANRQPLDWITDDWETAQSADFVQDPDNTQLYTYVNRLTGLACGTTYYYQNAWENFTSVSDDWEWSSNPGSSFTTAACNSAVEDNGATTTGDPSAPNTGLLRASATISAFAAGAGVVLAVIAIIFLIRLRKPHA